MTRRGNVEKIILDFAKAVCEGERTMIDEKKVELMKKLQRLAERGVGGEKEGAQKKLQQLMKKYDIEESDLSDDKLEDHEWKYHNDFELRLLKQTIDDFFRELDQEFHFNLDPCANEQNHKCEKYFTKEDNGLSKDWGGYRVFCNPPYGRAITDWVEKAYREGTKDNTIVVMLIPARTDTRYFHDFIQHRSEIRFVKGRLKFGNSKQAAPFPSMVVIFRGAGM